MRQLTSLDAQFLAVESATTYGHVGGLAIYDPASAPGGTLGVKDICRLVSERVPLLPPLRRRLVSVPLGLDHPYWIEDPDFDLDFQIRESAVPPPGGGPPSRRRATTASSPRPSRASSPARWTAGARCGSSTSSRGWRASARRC